LAVFGPAKATMELEYLALYEYSHSHHAVFIATAVQAFTGVLT